MESVHIHIKISTRMPTEIFFNISNIGLMSCVPQLMEEANLDALIQWKASQHYDEGTTEKRKKAKIIQAQHKNTLYSSSPKELP